MLEFNTIGVYNSSEAEFFNKLLQNNIDIFCDIRQRRAVRGSKYAFVNSKRLQSKLKEIGIQYKHEINLAPSRAIRNLQKVADQKNKVKTRERQELNHDFRVEYVTKVLDRFDFASFIDNLKKNEASKVVLFCVEEKAEGCHRSIVAQALHDKYHFKIRHI